MLYPQQVPISPVVMNSVQCHPSLPSLARCPHYGTLSEMKELPIMGVLHYIRVLCLTSHLRLGSLFYQAEIQIQ